MDVEIHLRGLDTLRRFSAILYKADNSIDFLFCFLAHQVPSEWGSTLKGKEFAPMGTRLFPFKVDFFLEGRQNNFERVIFPESISFPLKVTIQYRMPRYFLMPLVLLINQVIIVLICAKQPASYLCNVWHDFYMVLSRALYEG